MSRTAILFLGDNAFGASDAYAPLAAHLKAILGDDLTHDTVFLDTVAHGRLTRSDFHRVLFERLGPVHRMFPDGRGSRLLALLARVAPFLWLLLRRRITHRRFIVISPWAAGSRAERMILGLAGLFAELFWFPGGQMPYLASFSDRFRPEKWRMLLELGDKKNPGDGTREPAPPALGLCFLEQEIPHYREIKKWPTQLIPIGLPRLYPSWPAIVREVGDPVLADELRRLGLDPETPEIVCVVLTNPDYFWFGNEGGFLALLDDAVRAMRANFPDAPILLKSKSHIDHLYPDPKKRYGDPKIKMTLCGLAALSARAAVAVSIQESSGLLEFVTAEVPSIEYNSYSAEWLKIVPHGTILAEFPGVVVAKTKAELDAVLAQARDGGFPVCRRDDLAAHLGHRETLAAFIEDRAGWRAETPAHSGSTT